MNSINDYTLAKWQRKLIVGVLLLVAIFLIFQVAIFFADILRIIGISILIAYLVTNLVDFVSRFVPSRAIAISIVYVFVILLSIIGLILFVPAMIYQLTQLAETSVNALPGFIEWLTTSLIGLEQRFSTTNFHFKALDLLSSIASHLPTPDTGIILDRVSGAAMSTMTWLVYTISITVTSFYFLLDGHRIKNRFISWFPHNQQRALQEIAHDVDKSLQSFFRGQIVLGLGAGIIMMIIYASLGVHYGLLLGVVLAIGEIVPVIGPPLGFLPAIFSVSIHGMDHLAGNKFFEVVVLTVIFTVMQQLKDNVVAPRYIGNVIGLHPILIFISIMVGARLDGVVGVIFALPAACVLTVIINHLPLKVEDETVETT